MADILVHNAIKDIEAAINQGSSKINYGPMLGKTLKLYIKDIIDANATGPYGTPGGGSGNATQPICDLSNYLKKCIIASRLQKNKDVTFNKDSGIIEEINSLKFNSASGKFTLVKYDNLNN